MSGWTNKRKNTGEECHLRFERNFVLANLTTDENNGTETRNQDMRMSTANTIGSEITACLLLFE